MTEQFLQHFWLHPAFDCTRCIGVAQCVHAESPDSCLIAQFVKVGIIGTVFRRFPGTPVDKDKITHTQACSFSRAPIHVFQRGVEQFRFLSLRNLRIELFQDVVSMACQRDGAIAVLCFRRTRTPILFTVSKLQCFVDRERALFKVNRVPRQPDHLAGTQAGFKDQRVLVVVAGAFRCFKKQTLLVPGEELNIVCRTNRLCKPHTVHWVLGNQVIHLRSLEHRTHCDIGLTDGGTRIVSIHLNEHLFAVHRLDVGNHHFAHNGLNIVNISLPIIAERIRG